MKGKKNYTGVISATALILAILFFISGCSNLKTNTQENLVSPENQISTDTVSQTSEQQSNDNQNYQKWICTVRGCGYVYDPAVGDSTQGIAPGTKFEDLPSSWRCPICHEGKDKFIKL